MLVYSALVEDHFRRPRNAAAGTCHESVSGVAGSVERGTWIEFQLRVNLDRRVSRARFRAYGCPHTIALASWLTEYLPGRALRANFALDRDHILEVLELPVEKSHCVLVAEDALRACFESVEVNNGD